MRGDVVVGDVEVPALAGVGEPDTVVLSVAGPDGGGAELTATVTDGAATADDPVTYDQAGRWVLTWTVTTGDVVDVRVVEVYVVASPTAGGPMWTPGRSRVANYLPGRTLVREAGANVAALTFTSATNPPGVVVDRLIADAVAWVTAAAGSIAESLHDTAATVAAIFAASNVELSYPDRDTTVKGTSRNVAEDLYRRAKAMRDDLVRANAAAGETPGGGALLPVYSFPAPVNWGDTLL